MKIKNKIFFLIIDIFIFTISLAIITWIKESLRGITLTEYFYPIIGFLFIWILISFIGDKFEIQNKKKLSLLIIPVIKTDLIILSVILIINFSIKLHFDSRLLVFGTILLSSFFEILFCIVYFFNKRIEIDYDFPYSIKGASHLEEIEPKDSDIKPPHPVELPVIENLELSIFNNLKNRYLVKNQKLYNFIQQYIPIERIYKHESVILNTKTQYNFEYLEYNSIQLFINLHRINDIIRINKYFIQINKILKPNGYFINCVETRSMRKRRILNKFPSIINYVYYTFDFIFKRVMPKLPITKQIYFFLTQGHNRVISEPETLGRLYSCGFEVVEVKYLNNLLFFIAKKVGQPIYNNTPTYGPISRLERVGKNGNIFTVYKMRTMFPYSEYLQAYVYKKNNLEIGGKIKDDYRITTLGKFMRKFWLDEVPMFYNIFKGDMKLIGVRPLSRHYFSLYPEEFRQRRINYKPGLLPPFYADMPKTIDEIVSSEKKYFDDYDHSPLFTDIKYFFKIMYNILIKKARSK